MTISRSIRLVLTSAAVSRMCTTSPVGREQPRPPHAVWRSSVERATSPGANGLIAAAGTCHGYSQHLRACFGLAPLPELLRPADPLGNERPAELLHRHGVDHLHWLLGVCADLV